MELTNDVLYAVAPYAATLGISIEETSPTRVELRLVHRRQLQTIGGGMHGGALMSLAEQRVIGCGTIMSIYRCREIVFSPVAASMATSLYLN
jgi:hypothetical protein